MCFWGLVRPFPVCTPRLGRFSRCKLFWPDSRAQLLILLPYQQIFCQGRSELNVMRWTWVSQPPSKHFCLRRLNNLQQQQQRLFKTANTNSRILFDDFVKTINCKVYYHHNFASIRNSPRKNKNTKKINFKSQKHSINLLYTSSHVIF